MFRIKFPAMPEVRSRNGCITCKRRRRKCDEARPNCGSCQNRRLKCEYGDGLRWGRPNGLDRFVARRQRQRQPRAPQTAGSRPLLGHVSPVDQGLEGQEPVSSAQSNFNGQALTSPVDLNLNRLETAPLDVGFASDTHIPADQQLFLFDQQSPEQPRAAAQQRILDDPFQEHLPLERPVYHQETVCVENIDIHSEDDDSDDENDENDNDDDNDDENEEEDADEKNLDDGQLVEEYGGWAFDDEELWLHVGPEHFDSPGDRIAFAYCKCFASLQVQVCFQVSTDPTLSIYRGQVPVGNPASARFASQSIP